MRKTAAAFGLLLSISAATAFADAPSDVSSGDKKFIEEAASAGSLEVQLGQYAAIHATDQAVKDFGQQMDTDHTKVNEDLRGLAKSKNVTLDGTLNTKDEKKLAKLEKYDGAKFDKEYVNAMVKDHESVISSFEKEAKDGDSSEIKEFADKNLPALRHHLEMAKALADKT